MIVPTVLLLTCASLVLGHGRVTQPPSRASAWRLGFPTPANYDDDGLNCGGFSMQWQGNGGKCGICGDSYSIRPPRPHELGGTYGLGVIVAKYLPGATIATTTHLTASHMGYWEFKICPDPTDNTQACFNQHLLVSEDGETKYSPTQGSGIYEVNYKLPSGLVCDHCVLQWRYVAGNNWGVCSNGTSGLGCGNQEEFRACSDIAIGVSKTMSNNVEKIPSPLFYYLQHGFYEVDQGYLTRKDPKRPSPPQRPTNTKPSNRQPKPTKELSQTPQRQPHPNRQPQPSNRQPQPSNRQPQPSNRQPQPSNRQPQPQHLNGQQYPSQNQPYTSQHQSQQYRQQPSNRQPHPSKHIFQSPQLHSNAHGQHSNRSQPTNRLTQFMQHEPQFPNLPQYSNHLSNTTQSANRPPQHSNRQPHPSNTQPHSHHPSKPSQNSKRHKSAKRQPKPHKQPKLLRYEYKTNNKRKTKENKRRKKKKTQSGLHQKRNKPKRPVKVYEKHTYEYY